MWTIQYFVSFLIVKDSVFRPSAQFSVYNREVSHQYEYDNDNERVISSSKTNKFSD
jgi:hypothetical protein